MITLKQLTATTETTGVWSNNPGIRAAVHHEAFPGFFVHCLLSADGLLIKRGDAAVAVPLTELIRIAQQAEPRLAADNS